MDIERTDVARKRTRRRAVWGTAIAAAVVLASIALAQLEPAAPTVRRDALYVSEVRRGEMLRQVRGPGTLVPESQQWIAAAHDGRVERVLVRPGTEVAADTVVLELGNPELAQAAIDADSELEAGRADFEVLRAQLDSQILTQESVLAEVESESKQADLQLEADERLAAEGLLSELDLAQSRLIAAQLARRLEIERQRLERTRRSAEAQLAGRRSQLERLRAMAELRAEQLEALAVRAGMSGVLQEVQVEEGQRVTAGSTLALVADPTELMARLRIPETQARDLARGLHAEIDTRNGIVEGTVARVDPAVREGGVEVDVVLTDALPRGARPDLSVDGTIEIERLEDVLYVRRPAYGREGDTVSLFRLDPEGTSARRVEVELGRSSVSTIEVVRGLAAGDQVILSDTSQWDDSNRLRLN